MVTNREKINYLKQYKYIKNSITKLSEEKEIWRTKAEKMTSVISDMPKGTGGENKRELAICQMVECELEINRLIKQLNILKKEIREYISKTGNIDGELLLIVDKESKNTTYSMPT